MASPTGRVSRVVVAGPLAPFVDAYEAELRGRGYTPRTTVNQVRQVEAAQQLAWRAGWQWRS